MNSNSDLAGTSEEWVSGDTASVAEAVHDDFKGLIAIFDRQLSNGFDGEAKAAIVQARAAAERGLGLSERLIRLLRTPPTNL